jgi:hypothetical protein
MNLEEIGLVIDLIELAQNRVQWQACVLVVFSRGVKMSENVLQLLRRIYQDIPAVFHSLPLDTFLVTSTIGAFKLETKFDSKNDKEWNVI